MKFFFVACQGDSVHKKRHNQNFLLYFGKFSQRRLG